MTVVQKISATISVKPSKIVLKAVMHKSMKSHIHFELTSIIN